MGGNTLDQHHTGLRIALWGGGGGAYWTGPTSHWVEESSRGRTHWTNITQGKDSSMEGAGGTHWTNITLG